MTATTRILLASGTLFSSAVESVFPISPAVRDDA
jgi:hypothetical protein